MTKKDYKKIALAVQNIWAEFSHDGGDEDIILKDINIIVRELSDVLNADNPKFNREKFYDACGLVYLGR